MVTADTLREARAVVANVCDPEIPSLTIAELGILRDVSSDGDTVVVTITPTYSGCPAMGVIAEDILSALATRSLRGRIETVLSPPWTTDWLTTAARAKLRAEGIGAPGSSECPNCAGNDTTTVSEYGATACQALHVCRTCGEPFPYFKAHR